MVIRYEELNSENIAPEKIKEIHGWWHKNAPTTLINKIKLDYILALDKKIF
jgi:hypothetical protein